jgi:hypothetical protein
MTFSGFMLRTVSALCVSGVVLGCAAEAPVESGNVPTVETDGIEPRSWHTTVSHDGWTMTANTTDWGPASVNLTRTGGAQSRQGAVHYLVFVGGLGCASDESCGPSNYSGGAMYCHGQDGCWERQGPASNPGWAYLALGFGPYPAWSQPIGPTYSYGTDGSAGVTLPQGGPGYTRTLGTLATVTDGCNPNLPYDGAKCLRVWSDPFAMY